MMMSLTLLVVFSANAVLLLGSDSLHNGLGGGCGDAGDPLLLDPIGLFFTAWIGVQMEHLLRDVLFTGIQKVEVTTTVGIGAGLGFGPILALLGAEFAWFCGDA